MAKSKRVMPNGRPRRTGYRRLLVTSPDDMRGFTSIQNGGFIMNDYIHVLRNYRNMLSYSRRLRTIQKSSLLVKIDEWEDTYYYNLYYRRWG